MAIMSDRRQNGMQNGINGGLVARQQKKGVLRGALTWADSQILAYNVTFGLYMLDWWERILFNALFLMLVWFLCYNGSEFLVRAFLESTHALKDWATLWPRRGSVHSHG